MKIHLLLIFLLALSSVSGFTQTIEQRFSPPNGFERVNCPSGSYQQYLRQLKLYPEGRRVMDYRGNESFVKDAAAVLLLDLENRDLQQCADVAMRLKAEYLFSEGRFDEISFPFTNGFDFDYNHYKDGYRVKVNGNQTTWIKSASPDSSYSNFRRYLTFLYVYAGSLSLEKQARRVELKDLQIGDILIRGGSPGHVVTIVDIAVNANGQQVAMFAQGYMPAMDAHILSVPGQKGNPWFPIEGEFIDLGYWQFSWASDLARIY